MGIMKKTRKKALLSVLLFVFAFFVVHDYVIADVDTDTQYEICLVQQYDPVQLDLPSQIHEHIHILQALPDVSPVLTVAPGAGHIPTAVFLPPHSRIHDVPHRPPLA